MKVAFTCKICGNKSFKLLLCKDCIKNPYLVEDLREKLSQNNETKNFLLTYKSPYPQITNKNTQIFWDKKFHTETILENQDGMTKDKIKTLANLIPQTKSSILDLGIGQGYLEEQLTKEKRENYELYGIDISKKSIKKIKKKYKGDFVVGDILEINKIYKDKTFDVIVAIEVIEHISPKNILSFFQNVNAHLKKGGIFLISTPLNEGLRYRDTNPSEHVREYTIPTLTLELELSGFTIGRIKTFTAFQNQYFLKKQLSKVVRKWKSNDVVVLAKKS